MRSARRSAGAWSATRRSSRTSSRTCSRPSPATCGASIASSSPPTTTAISRRTSARRRPTFEGGIVAGIDERAFATVGAELTATDPSTLEPFIDAGLATVDHLDLPAGEVSLVYALDGYDGNYGIKDEARSYLPDFERGPASAGTP